MLFRRQTKLPNAFTELAQSEQVLSFTNSHIGPIVATEAGLRTKEFQIFWHQMFQARFEPPTLTISFQSDSGNKQLQLNLEPILEPNDFPNLVRGKITSNVIAQSKIEFQPELFVTISARRKNKDEIKFVISADSGIDISEHDFKQWAEVQLREFKETFGL